LLSYGIRPLAGLHDLALFAFHKPSLDGFRYFNPGSEVGGAHQQ